MLAKQLTQPLNTKEWWSPEELGLPFPKAYRIYVEKCGNGEHFGLGVYGHTHKNIYDPLFNSICIPFSKYMWNSDGSISQLMWHEYAHVIDRYYIDPKVDNFKTQEELQEAAHGWHFLQAVETLGYPEAAKRTIVWW